MNKLIRRWRYGIQYGCGRCHHGVRDHYDSYYSCQKCNCKAYSIDRILWWKVLFGIY